MAQRSVYNQGRDTSSNDITDYEPISPSPLSDTVPFFEPGIRSSTWPIATNGSHDVNFYYNQGGYNDGADDQMHNVEPEASDPGSIEHWISEPIDTPEGYTPLTFRPTILTRRILVVITVFYLVNLGLLGYLAHRSRSAKVWDIHNVNYYLAARFLPAVIGVCTNILFSNITSTLRRILPFINMADQKNTKNRYRMEQTVGARYFPYAPVFWKEWLMCFLVASNYAFHLTLLAKASLFSVEDTGRGIWHVSVRLVPAIYLCFTYLIAASISVFITIKYAGCSTGLKEDWDPTSLADIILLFMPSDDVPTLDHSLHHGRWDQMVRKWKARYRLGYWKMTNMAGRPPCIVYGIREIFTDKPTDNARHPRPDCMDHQRPLTPCSQCSERLENLPDQHSVRHLSMDSHDSARYCQHHPRCSHYPYRRGPFIPDAWLLILVHFLLATISFCLAFALVRIWWCQGIVLQTGTWLIQSNNLMPGPNGTQFVIPGIEFVELPKSLDRSVVIRDYLAFLLLRGLPISVVSWSGQLIANLDIHHRWVQPFTNMYEKPCLASDSLLLDYMTVSPLEAIPQAWTKGHYKVVYFGLLSALNWVPPLTLVGLCTVNETGSGVVVQLSPIFASFAVIWIGIYIYSLSFFWPPPKRRLPRNVGSLYDLFCFFYDSELRQHPIFFGAAYSKHNTKEKLHARLRLIEEEFSFGLLGDPRDPLPGFDYADNVTWVEPIPGRCGWMKKIFKRRKDNLSRSNHGSSSDSEYDAVPLDDLGVSASTHHRGPFIREDP